MTIATASDPAVSRHRLGAELRQLRLSRALRMTDVAGQLGIAPSTLSRIETGKAPIRASYIRVLLDLYDVTDAEQRRALTDLATHGQQDDWCSEAARLLPSETLRYYGLEAAATRIQAFAGAVIPGLLRTPEYAAATWHTARPGLTSEDAAALASLTGHRRSAFDDGPHRLHAVIDESALLRPAGNWAMERWALVGLGECLAHQGDYDLARGHARQALELGPEPGDPLSLARAWSVLGLVHSRVGEHSRAISCYRQALALTRQRNGPQARLWLADLLTNFGDACRTAGDLPAAVQCWQQARQILDDLRLPDNLGVRGRLQQAGAPSAAGLAGDGG